MRPVAGVMALAAVLAAAAPTLGSEISDIRGLLTREPLVCGGFTQRKFLKALTRPLVSRGRVVYAEGKGVLWQVLTPFPARVLVKADALIRWDDDDRPKRTGLGKSPPFRALSDVFLAVFAGDTGRLSEAFEVDVVTTQGAWRFDLKPRDDVFAGQITGIRVSGDRVVKELELAEGRGDRTVIRFRDLTGDGCALSAAEKRYLAR